MPIVADQYDYVVGVDTHARTHTYVVMQSGIGKVLSSQTFPTSHAGIGRAMTWIWRNAPGRIIAAVEGTSSYGAGLTHALTEAGIVVVEARPPKRTSRAGRGKSDVIDAEAAARCVIGADFDRLPHPRSGQLRSALRILLGARQSMDRQRGADRNALNAILRTVDLNVDARRAVTDTQINQIAAWRNHAKDTMEQATARFEARRLARSVVDLTRLLADNWMMLHTHVEKLAPGLMDIHGVGPVTGAKFLVAYSHRGRVHSEAAFASLAGAAPIPASSGNTTRFRLNRHGDRQLNNALDVVARVRLRHDPSTREYKKRRTAEGKTPREIRRILKRYIAREIYRFLQRAIPKTA